MTRALFLTNYNSLTDPWTPVHWLCMSNCTQQDSAPCEAVETQGQSSKKPYMTWW